MTIQSKLSLKNFLNKNISHNKNSYFKIVKQMGPVLECYYMVHLICKIKCNG